MALDLDSVAAYSACRMARSFPYYISEAFSIFEIRVL
jgi:hypothetical protein